MPTREQLNDSGYVIPSDEEYARIRRAANAAMEAAKLFNTSCQKVQDVYDEDIESVSYGDWIRSHFEEKKVKLPSFEIYLQEIKGADEKSRREAFEQRIKNDAKRMVKL